MIKCCVAVQGICKSFDASANGYARADGIAIVVLRKAGLKEQIGTWAARHPYAQVLACATNNDGHTKEGITFPSGPAQKALAQEVTLSSPCHADEPSDSDLNAIAALQYVAEAFQAVGSHCLVCSPLLLMSHWCTW